MCGKPPEPYRTTMGLFDSFGKMLNVNEFVANLTGYLENRLALAKVEMRQEISDAIGKLMFFLVIAFVGVMALIMTSITLGAFLNFIFNSQFLGYLIVAFLYITTFGLLMRFREHPTVKGKINNAISRFFKEKNKLNTDESQQSSNTQ
ncbi:Putative Holin-X, holin superfamily III [Flexibacter flexilis DSM 6793]|uniref:Putative Holin-X, holin superfamily III n=2 Tax=Flexibacter flexilis TaxID=998 RepID=A0A1I1K2I6_9BACT|nr:Putative Holin-X, holin superfamily III [Flexibacter flexilis DSM 6793]